MVLNTIKDDIKHILIDKHMTQKELAELAGVRNNYISKMYGVESPVTASIVTLFECLGYDIKLEYVKREDPENK